MIQEIEVSLAYGITTLQKSKKFNISTYCITDFFLRLLEKFDIGKVKKIVIECWEEEITKKTNPADDSMNVVVLRRQIKLDKYFASSEKEKKKWVLAILMDGFKELNKHFEFSFTRIESVAKTIKELDYQNHYHYGKLVTSPNRKMTAQLWIEHEMEKFNLYVDVFNNEKELEERIFVVETFPNWVGYLPVLGSIKWDTDKSIVVIGKNKKVLKKIKVDK